MTIRALFAYLLGHAAPPDDQPQLRVKAIERELYADDWLIYCAQDNITRFEWWWNAAQFHESVVRRFMRSNPGVRPPLKDETGRILEALIRRDGCRLVINPETHKMDRF